MLSMGKSVDFECLVVQYIGEESWRQICWSSKHRTLKSREQEYWTKTSFKTIWGVSNPSSDQSRGLKPWGFPKGFLILEVT